jgi:hypothetical protein
MGNHQLVTRTTSRSVFNKAYKRDLEKKGKIHCSICPYNGGENSKIKCYGGYAKNGGIRYPSWKLTSKYPKQWMKKRNIITIEEWGFRKEKYTRVTW